jgi:hypothetical protein
MDNATLLELPLDDNDAAHTKKNSPPRAFPAVEPAALAERKGDAAGPRGDIQRKCEQGGINWKAAEDDFDAFEARVAANEGDFNWNVAEDEGLVIIPAQASVAVYFNKVGAIVIRQETGWGEDDHWVYIQPANLHHLIKRLTEIAKS